MSSKQRSLADWLEWQQHQHSQSIDLGLDRVSEVHARLGARRPARQVITVAGTNGKGSCVALLDSMLRAAGHRTGCYTSPHLLRYNERIKLDGLEIGDAALCQVFERIERHRGSNPLTYYEYGTLAALESMADAGLDLALLEVGLGGRLDAVNLIDADAALISSIDLDHQGWLGPDRETIGYEKAGIFRADCPAVVGDLELPRSVRDHASSLGCGLIVAGEGYRWALSDQGWSWQYGSREPLDDLPMPALPGKTQLDNAAACLACLWALDLMGRDDRQAIEQGLIRVRLPGRLECLQVEPPVIADVAHNPAAARVLADWLASQPQSGWQFVLGMLSDKDAAAVVEPLERWVRAWHLASLDVDRGLPASTLAARIAGTTHAPMVEYATPVEALAGARAELGAGEGVLCIGSFHTVAAVMAEFDLDWTDGPPRAV